MYFRETRVLVPGGRRSQLTKGKRIIEGRVVSVAKFREELKSRWGVLIKQKDIGKIMKGGV